MHVHVRKDGNPAKFWTSPAGLANNQGFSGKEVNNLAQIVETRRDEIERAWHEHFGDQARLRRINDVGGSVGRPETRCAPGVFPTIAAGVTG
ncbi:DUF4160 domain-containing protein [Thiobacillus sp. 63-78]|uniref:DUF4160 domain-containing protein n=1 Tax=Thiobacillus sp. 63-78 TaxID=1895859 RepID=UPI00344B80E8